MMIFFFHSKLGWYWAGVREVCLGILEDDSEVQRRNPKHARFYKWRASNFLRGPGKS
jgi:hypothetical protein